MKYLIFLLLLIPSISFANTEISTSNIGIGTSSVANNLSVGGGLAVGGSTYTNTTAPSNGAIIQGNVGVGSANPGQSLDVAGTVRSSLGFVAGTGTATITGSGSNILLAQSSGNVGIGSANPGVSLDVVGSLRLNGSGHGIVFQDGTSMLTASSGGGTGANPTATIGLSAVNGSATTFLRSDGAPALGVAITPTWTGTHIFNGTPSIETGGNVSIGTTNAANNVFTVMGNVSIGTTTAATAPLVVTGSGGIGLTTSGNVGIGTTLGDSLVGVGGGFHAVASATTGRIFCVGLSTLGQACLGFCTSISTDTCACTCG